MNKFYTIVFVCLTCFKSLFAQTQIEIDQLNLKAESTLNQSPKTSLTDATTAKANAERIGYKKGIASALAILGVANYKIDDYVKARLYINQSIALSEEIKDSSNLSFSKYWLANIELNKGEYGKALDLYQASLAIAEKIGDKKNIARCLDGKATIYESLNEDQKALEFYNQSLATAKEINFKEWYGGVVFSLGNHAFKKGNNEEAIAKYREAIKLSEETNNLNNKANALQQLASVYYEKQNSKEAMKYVQEAMEIFQQTGSMSSFSHSRLLMSTILLIDKEYDLSIDLAKMSLEEGRANGELELQESAAYTLYYAYYGKGDKANALNYYVKYHTLSEAKRNEELTKKLTQMELQANFKKEREIAKAIQDKKDAELNAQLEKQTLIKKASFIGIALLAIIASLAIFAFFQKQKDNRMIALEKRKSDDLLLNILPAEIANELKEKGHSKAKNYDMATVMFADIKNFTGAAERMTPDQLVSEIDFYFKNFDEIVTRYKIEKIKTIGDAYLCVGGLPIADFDNAFYVVSAALEIQRFMQQVREDKTKKGEIFFEIRIGIHTGPLIAGIVGLRKFAYDIWGDTVNVAARMEQHGEEGKINISGSTYNLIKEKFTCTHRGKIEAKHKGEIDMYFVTAHAD